MLDVSPGGILELVLRPYAVVHVRVGTAAHDSKDPTASVTNVRTARQANRKMIVNPNATGGVGEKDTLIVTLREQLAEQVKQTTKLRRKLMAATVSSQGGAAPVPPPQAARPSTK